MIYLMFYIAFGVATSVFCFTILGEVWGLG